MTISILDIYRTFVEVCLFFNKHELDFWVSTGGGTWNVASGELQRGIARMGRNITFKQSQVLLKNAFLEIGEEPCFMAQFIPGPYQEENEGDVFDALRLTFIKISKKDNKA